MTEKHPVEDDIQQFVLDETGCSPDLIAHMRQCVDCQAKAETYQLLFSVIKQEPKPRFEFDLSAVVLSQISTEKSKFSLDTLRGYLLTSSVLAAIAIAAFVFKAKIIYVYEKYILAIISGVSAMIVTFLVVTILIFIVFQCAAMYKRYRQKIDDLNFY